MSFRNTQSYPVTDADIFGGNQNTCNVRKGMYFRFEGVLYFIKEVKEQMVSANVALDKHGNLDKEKEERIFSCDNVLPGLLSGSDAIDHINGVLGQKLETIMALRNNKKRPR